MPVTPTVSVWPHNISVRPAPRPSSTPTTFGRPWVTVSIDTSSPPRRISAAISSAISRSPGAPRTSVGFTELTATSSRSRRIAGSHRGHHLTASMLSSQHDACHRHHRRIGGHRARDGAAAGARRRVDRDLRAARRSARGGRRRDHRRRRAGARDRRRRHPAKRTWTRSSPRDGRALRSPRRDDVQRRLRHRRRDRRHRAGPDAEADGRQLHGTYHAARAALPVFRRQGRGHIIIVSSIVGKRGVPYMGAYAATKFAQVGLAECLRAELAGTDIHVSVVFPISTETEFFDVMTRETGATVTRAMGPRQSAEEVADAIARAIDRPVPEVYPHAKSRALVVLNAIAPGFTDRVVKRFGRKPVRGTEMTEATGHTEQQSNGEVQRRVACDGPAKLAISVRCFVASFLYVIPLPPSTALTRRSMARPSSTHRHSRPGCRRPRARSSAAGCAIGCSACPSRRKQHRSRGVRRSRRAAARAARIVRPRRSGRRELSGLQDRRHRRLAAAARLEGRPRPPRLRSSTGDPGHVDRRGRAAARLHRQRDLVGSADRRVLRSVRRPRRSRAAAAARRRSADLRRRQPARAARRPVRGALRVRARAGDGGDSAAQIPLDDLPAERVWGEFEKLLFAPRPSIGFALAMDLGVVAKLFPELQALAGCPQEPEWHPEGDVWVHTLQVIDQARTRIDDLPRPQQLAVMLGAVCHDLGKPATTKFLDGRIRSLDHEEQGVAPASAFLDRLNVQLVRRLRRAQAGARHHRAASEAGIVVQGARRGRRRRLPPARAQGGSRAAGARREVRLRRAASPASSTAPRWTGFSSGRARSASSIARREPILLGRHLLALGLKPGPRVGEILKAVYEQQMDGTVTTLDEAIAAANRLLIPDP